TENVTDKRLWWEREVDEESGRFGKLIRDVWSTDVTMHAAINQPDERAWEDMEDDPQVHFTESADHIVPVVNATVKQSLPSDFVESLLKEFERVLVQNPPNPRLGVTTISPSIIPKYVPSFRIFHYLRSQPAQGERWWHLPVGTLLDYDVYWANIHKLNTKAQIDVRSFFTRLYRFSDEYKIDDFILVKLFMQIGFVILGIAAVFLLIIGAFCSRKFMEKRRREKPAAKTETAQKKPNVAAKRATMNIAGLSADGPSMPGSRPTVRAETRVPVSNEPQTTINLAMLQSRPQETPVSQPVVQPVVQPESTQPMMPAGQMPFMYPPYMMGMAPGTSTPQMGTPQMSTPQMAHMPNGYPMGFGAQMWPPFMHMGQMMPNYPPNSTV
ncbi:hypothetical protein GGH20_004050, partial [Coemansia sp. RSA 1937]